MQAIRDPQLGAVEHVIILLAGCSHGNSLHIAARVRFRKTDPPAFVTFTHHGEKSVALLLSAVGLKHIGNQYMRIDDPRQAHPTARKLLDYLRVGEEI